MIGRTPFLCLSPTSIRVLMAFILLPALAPAAKSFKQSSTDEKMCMSLLYDSELGGQMRVLVTPSGRSVFVRGRVGNMIVNPPDYKTIITMNPENRTYIYSAERRRGRENLYPIFSCELGRVKGPGSQETIKGFKCARYKLLQTLSSGKKSPVGDIWCTNDIKIEPGAVDALCRMMRAPEGHGMPTRILIKANFVDRSNIPYGKRGPYLELLEVSSVPFQPEKFRIPPGYRQADDVTEFIFSKGGRIKKSDIDDLFRQPIKE